MPLALFCRQCVGIHVPSVLYCWPCIQAGKPVSDPGKTLKMDLLGFGFNTCHQARWYGCIHIYAFLCRHVDQNQLQQVPYIRHDATTYYVCCLLVLCHLFCRKEIKIKSIYRKWQILYVMWLIQQSLHRSTLDNGMLQTAVQHSLQEKKFGCYLRAPDQTWFW